MFSVFWQQNIQQRKLARGLVSPKRAVKGVSDEGALPPFITFPYKFADWRMELGMTTLRPRRINNVPRASPHIFVRNSVQPVHFDVPPSLTTFSIPVLWAIHQAWPAERVPIQKNLQIQRCPGRAGFGDCQGVVSWTLITSGETIPHRYRSLETIPHRHRGAVPVRCCQHQRGTGPPD